MNAVVKINGTIVANQMVDETTGYYVALRLAEQFHVNVLNDVGVSAEAYIDNVPSKMNEPGFCYEENNKSVAGF